MTKVIPGIVEVTSLSFYFIPVTSLSLPSKIQRISGLLDEIVTVLVSAIIIPYLIPFIM